MRKSKIELGDSHDTRTLPSRKGEKREGVAAQPTRMIRFGVFGVRADDRLE